MAHRIRVAAETLAPGAGAVDRADQAARTEVMLAPRSFA